MKNMFNRIFLCLSVAVMALSGCEKEGHGDFALSVKETGADYVDIFVTAPSDLEVAYVVSTERQLVTPAVLFATGTVVTVSPAQVLRIDTDIVQDTHYYLYAVAKLNATDYSAKLVLEFTTKKYGFSDLVTLVDTYPTGYKVHITVPESVKESGHVIRYGSTSLAWYNLLKSSKGDELGVDLNAVVANGNPYGNYVKNDSTIVIDDWNVVKLDENGTPVLDSDGQQIDIHDPIAPGEPTIFLAGECRWGTPDEYADIMGFHAPEKNSYSIPLFNWKDGWTGAFQKITFFAQEPTLCEATVEVEIPEDEITVTDAMVYFTVGEGVSRYFYIVLDNNTYNQVLSTYLDGHEEWWQWFLTSYIAFYEWGVYPDTEDVTINAAASFNDGALIGGDTYHVLCTVMGDDAGTTQNFVHKTFQAKPRTKVAPVIEVTALPETNPYEASFNIKAGVDSDGNIQPIAGAYWACNYAREFELMFNAKYTYEDILKGNYTFTSDELNAINSPEGLTLTFPTLDGEVTRFAAYGCNDEFNFNVVDPDPMVSKLAKGWADYHAPLADPVAPVSSPLFEALEGDWTLTATIVAKEVLSDGSTVSYNLPYKSKVTISQSAPALPDALDPSVYSLYPDKTKADVDGMFEELGYLTERFTEYRLKGRNMLLCNGFVDFDYYSNPGRMTYRTPYELFTATDYNSVDVPQLIYDFGPKWFLEVREDGSVIVPFDSMYLPPMHNWPGYTYYVGGVGDGTAFVDANENYPGFPVEVSSDYNTITVKPIVLTDGSNSYSYYMNALSYSSTGEFEIVATVISELVLTRGWTEIEVEQPDVTPETSSVRLMNIDGSAVTELPKARVYKSMTKLVPKPAHSYVEDETPNVVTMEMVDKASARILKYFNIE